MPRKAIKGCQSSSRMHLQAIKSLPFKQRRWDADNKVWSVDKDVLDEALDLLRAAPVHAQIIQPPPVNSP